MFSGLLAPNGNVDHSGSDELVLSKHLLILEVAVLDLLRIEEVLWVCDT
jgi:hypothetical protein